MTVRPRAFVRKIGSTVHELVVCPDCQSQRVELVVVRESDPPVFECVDGNHPSFPAPRILKDRELVIDSDAWRNRLAGGRTTIAEAVGLRGVVLLEPPGGH